MHVRDWLLEEGLQRYASIFLEHRLDDLHVCSTIDDKDLIEMKIETPYERQRIMAAVRDIRKRHLCRDEATPIRGELEKRRDFARRRRDARLAGSKIYGDVRDTNVGYSTGNLLDVGGSLCSLAPPRNRAPPFIRQHSTPAKSLSHAPSSTPATSTTPANSHSLAVHSRENNAPISEIDTDPPSSTDTDYRASKAPQHSVSSSELGNINGVFQRIKNGANNPDERPQVTGAPYFNGIRRLTDFSADVRSVGAFDYPPSSIAPPLPPPPAPVICTRPLTRSVTAEAALVSPVISACKATRGISDDPLSPASPPSASSTSSSGNGPGEDNGARASVGGVVAPTTLDVVTPRTDRNNALRRRYSLTDCHAEPVTSITDPRAAPVTIPLHDNHHQQQQQHRHIYRDQAVLRKQNNSNYQLSSLLDVSSTSSSSVSRPRHPPSPPVRRISADNGASLIPSSAGEDTSFSHRLGIRGCDSTSTLPSPQRRQHHQHQHRLAGDKSSRTPATIRRSESEMPQHTPPRLLQRSMMRTNPYLGSQSQLMNTTSQSGLSTGHYGVKDSPGSSMSQSVDDTSVAYESQNIRLRRNASNKRRLRNQKANSCFIERRDFSLDVELPLKSQISDTLQHPTSEAQSSNKKSLWARLKSKLRITNNNNNNNTNSESRKSYISNDQLLNLLTQVRDGEFTADEIIRQVKERKSKEELEKKHDNSNSFLKNVRRSFRRKRSSKFSDYPLDTTDEFISMPYQSEKMVNPCYTDSRRGEGSYVHRRPYSMAFLHSRHNKTQATRMHQQSTPDLTLSNHRVPQRQVSQTSTDFSRESPLHRLKAVHQVLKQKCALDESVEDDYMRPRGDRSVVDVDSYRLSANASTCSGEPSSTTQETQSSHRLPPYGQAGASGGGDYGSFPEPPVASSTPSCSAAIVGGGSGGAGGGRSLLHRLTPRSSTTSRSGSLNSASRRSSLVGCCGSSAGIAAMSTSSRCTTGSSSAASSLSYGRSCTPSCSSSCVSDNAAAPTTTRTTANGYECSPPSYAPPSYAPPPPPPPATTAIDAYLAYPSMADYPEIRKARASSSSNSSTSRTSTASSSSSSNQHLHGNRAALSSAHATSGHSTSSSTASSCSSNVDQNIGGAGKSVAKAGSSQGVHPPAAPASNSDHQRHLGNNNNVNANVGKQTPGDLFKLSLERLYRIECTRDSGCYNSS